MKRNAPAEPSISTDRYLRSWGFVIATRPADGEATWRDRLTGRVVTETEAVELAKARERSSKA